MSRGGAGGQGEIGLFRACVAGWARHNAARCAWMLLLAARQEVAKKRAKTFPLGTPLAGAQTTLRWRSTHICAELCKFRSCVGVLMIKRQHGSSTHDAKAKVFAMCYAPLLAQISNKNGKAKTFANSKPILGVRYMRPRWRTFAKTKTPAVHRQNGGQ